MIIRSKRKTLALYITKNGLEVRAPLKLSQKKIDEFVASKAHWINKHLSDLQELHQGKANFELDYGSAIRLYGDKFFITPLGDLEDQQKPYLSGDELRITSGKSQSELKTNIIAYYKAEAKQLINNQVGYFSGVMNLSTPKVKITSAHTRWGSCSSKGNINFSWRLIMADKAAIDYVIIHELCHLTHHNHSEKFWNLVKKYCPDYKAQRSKLKALGRKLLSEDWN